MVRIIVPLRESVLLSIDDHSANSTDPEISTSDSSKCAAQKARTLRLQVRRCAALHSTRLYTNMTRHQGTRAVAEHRLRSIQTVLVFKSICVCMCFKTLL